MEPHSYKYKQICKGPKPHTLERCKCKNNEGIHGHNFQYGLDKKNEINNYWSETVWALPGFDKWWLMTDSKKLFANSVLLFALISYLIY